MLIGWWMRPEIPGSRRARGRSACDCRAGDGRYRLAYICDCESERLGMEFARHRRQHDLHPSFYWRCSSGDCFRLPNPFVNPALFRIRPFAGAALVMAPYSAAFGAMLLSVALWEQTAWGWSALKTGLAIAPGPLLVPITSLLFAGRLIARFGAAPVVTAGYSVLCRRPGLLGQRDRARAESRPGRDRHDPDRHRCRPEPSRP